MKPIRILVVEDDAMIGTLLSEMLSTMGYEVYPLEATEAGAIAAAERYQPDLVMMDAHLGRESGVSAIGQIIKARPVPYLFMSGSSVAGGWADAVTLKKPFRESDLRYAIGRALSASR